MINIIILLLCSISPSLTSFTHKPHVNKFYDNQQIKFYAYSDDVQDSFNEQCILCTDSKDYAATIAFTKHWKITYWKNRNYSDPLFHGGI